MDNILIVSNIILWLLVIGLSFLVFALARQVGVLFERVAPAGALMINKTLEVGMPAPQVEVTDINSGTNLIAGTPVPGRAQLLFFLSPDCPVCKSLLPVIKSAQTAEKNWIDVVLASDGEIEAHRDYIQRQGLENFTYVSSKALGIQYGIAKLPFAVLVKDDGIISSYGLINSREHIESLFEAKERGVSSIQGFLGKDNDTQITNANLA